MSGPNQSNQSSSGMIINPAGLLIDKESMQQRMSSPVSPSRPGSSDGSTTVSATSSPGIDQQEERENTIKMKLRIPEMAYKAVEQMYNKQQQQQGSSTSSSKTPSTSSQHSTNTAPAVGGAIGASSAQLQKQNSTTSGSSNGSGGGGVVEDVSPRKKPRKQNM